MNRMTIAENICSELERFDRVFAVMDGGDDIENLACSFCRSKAMQETSEKILILSGKEIPGIKNLNCQFRRINEKEMDIIRQLYFMYDFSDRFQVLADSTQYGSLLNYVKSGDMTMETVFQTLLES